MRVFRTLSLMLVLAPQLVIADVNACDRAASKAALKTGVPVEVLLALTRTETGRRKDGRIQPWPWTVNMEGKGHWFSDEQSARAFVFKHFKAGARSFDVGCFQVNYKWHGAAFASIESMFDPTENAIYAAKFIQSLKTPSASWEDAAGAYHSKTPVYAQKYRTRFGKILAALPSQDKLPGGAVLENGFPLLTQGRGSSRMGSLFVIEDGARKPFILTGGNG